MVGKALIIQIRREYMESRDLGMAGAKNSAIGIACHQFGSKVHAVGRTAIRSI